MDELFRLEDILRHVYTGRADIEMIDELIDWLKIRRSALDDGSNKTKRYTHLQWCAVRGGDDCTCGAQ